MDRAYIINYLRSKINANDYLEIGYGDGVCFSTIECKNKTAVDPFVTDTLDVVTLESDAFFLKNKNTFDLIFIDGLHHSDQLYRDISNSLDILNKGGWIAIHNTLPYTNQMQEVPYQGGLWTGDCWKAVVSARQTIPNIDVFTIDIDYGLTIIRKSENDTDLLEPILDMSYDSFLKNKIKWLNVINIFDFYSMFAGSNHTQLLDHYIHYPQCDLINFNMGVFYESIGQTAAAISFYVRCSERTNDVLLQYESMLRAGLCFEKQGIRDNSVIGLYQHAVSLLPWRPEGYFLLSRFYEHSTRWFDGYTMASIAEKMVNFNSHPLRTNVEYPGPYGILFEKAVVSWWCGLCAESIDLFKHLLLNYNLSTIHRESCITNLLRLDGSSLTNGFKFDGVNHEILESYKHLNLYYDSSHENLKIKFDGSDLIKRNHSEAFQDMFVLTALGGKMNGSYLEIGAGCPVFGNNTYLLESEFDWSGISIDIVPDTVDTFNLNRKNKAILADALEVNYEELLNKNNLPNSIDYLQLDCDTPEVTYNILLRIPFDVYKFGVITFEHDSYADPSSPFKRKSRKYLKKLGYVLVVSNVSPRGDNPFEDWWIHPDIVDVDVLKKLGDLTNDKTKESNTIFLNK